MAYDPRRSRSVSQLNSFTKCGEAFRLERIEKKSAPPFAWTVLGTAVHTALELWERSDREADVAQLFEEAWEKELAERMRQHPDLKTWGVSPRVKSTERDLELHRAKGLAQVATYVERATAEAHLWKPLVLEDGRLALELPFTLEQPGSPFVIRGYIDLIKQWSGSDILTVGDLKSGGNSRENYRQLGLYRVAIKDNYGLDVDYGEYWYTKLDRSSGWKDLTRYTKDYIFAEYGKLDTAIASGLFLANPSPDNCHFCLLKPHCEEMRGR